MTDIITPAQADILRHALGLGVSDVEYRNRFVTGPGSDDYPHCEALVASGLMTIRTTPAYFHPDDRVYVVTDAGRAKLREMEVP